MNFLNQLPSNPIAWLFMAIIGICALILAYKSTPQKVLKFSIENTNIIKNTKSNLEKLEIIYAGKPINNLTISKVTFWNGSFPTINKTDIIENAPLSICASNGKILDASILAGDDTSNRISIDLDNNTSPLISFDYLDKNEGGIIQVVHTGNSDSINFSRKIKGGNVKQIKRRLLSIIITPVLALLYTFIASCVIVINQSAMKIVPLILITTIFVVSFIFFEIKLDQKFVPKNCRQK